MAQEPDSIDKASEPASAGGTKSPTRGVLLLRVVLPLLAIVAGLAISFWLMKSGPEAKTRAKGRSSALVNIQPVEFAPRQVMIEALGTVRPMQEVNLKPQVSGEVVELNAEFQLGSFFRRGELLLRIDATDYQLAVDQAASEVARAEAELQLEQGNQLVALKEFELLGEPVSDKEKSLMLRQPQLETLRALLDAAKAKQQQAQVSLRRTEIRSPFNAVLVARGVDLGSRVSTGNDLATLVGTDRYWIEVSVPVSQLRWIRIPQAGSESGAAVKIYNQAAWGDGVYRVGHVARLAATLEEKGRMARLLIEVPDPLALAVKNARQPGLLLNSYVRVEIEGRGLDSAAAISRALLRDNDTVWIMDANDQLDIRKVKIGFRGEDEVFLTGGVADGEQLITSHLPIPVQGMPLRLPDAPEQPERAGQQ